MSRTPLYETLLHSNFAAPSHKIRPSAAVVPWRQNGHGEVRVYWQRRARTMAFMGGFHAFPGGGLSRKRDLGVPVVGRPEGASEGVTPPIPDWTPERGPELEPDLAPGLVACALRELFEETGLLVVDGDDEPEPERLSDLRRRLLARELDMKGVLAELGRSFDASPLVFAGRWLTPPFVPNRFDNRFFLLHWPSERAVQPSLMGGEADVGEWIAPEAAYDRWLAGEVLAAPPILHLLRILGEFGPRHGLARLRRPDEANLGPMRRIEFRPGVIVLPLRTPTLPPADHTNAFLIGRGEAVLVDPSTPFEDEQERLLAALDAAREQGYAVREIWLTHHHSDHVGAVERVREHLDVPVMAHPETSSRLAARGLRIDGELFHGRRVVLDGAPSLTVSVHHTPGHAPGHLCFYEETFKTLIAGDLISTLSTIVVDPPDGHMGDYLESLERMAELDVSMVYPSHGPGTLDHRRKLEEYRDHRLEREAMVLRAFREGKTTPEAMVAEIYHDVPEHVHPVAARQIQAHLDHLREKGEI